MTLSDRVQLIVQQWLAANNEAAMWLRGAKGREWNREYERCLDAVHRSLMREIDWREWLTMQAEVVECVRSLLRGGDH